MVQGSRFKVGGMEWWRDAALYPDSEIGAARPLVDRGHAGVWPSNRLFVLFVSHTFLVQDGVGRDEPLARPPSGTAAPCPYLIRALSSVLILPPCLIRVLRVAYSTASTPFPVR